MRHNNPFISPIRKIRADEIANALMNIIYEFVNDRDDCTEIFCRIRNLLESHGAEIVTDATRKAAGLPPRDPHGWTYEELKILEKHRLEILTRPLPLLIEIAKPVS